MELETIMLCEVSQRRGTDTNELSHMWNTQKPSTGITNEWSKAAKSAEWSAEMISPGQRDKRTRKALNVADAG